MQGFIMQLRRRPLVWCLLTLALALAMAVSLTGLNAWLLVRQQSGKVSDAYVTIAVPLNKELMSEEAAELRLNAALESGILSRLPHLCLLPFLQKAISLICLVDKLG